VKPGQPLRFLGWILGGWVTMRAAMLLIPMVEGIGEPISAERMEAQTHEVALARRAAGLASVSIDHTSHAQADIGLAGPAAVSDGQTRSGTVASDRSGTRQQDMSARPELAMPQPRVDASDMAKLARAQVDISDKPVPADRRTDEGRYLQRRAETGGGRAVVSPWSGTAWMLWRPDMAGGLAQAPLLGGSQLGARLDYRVAGGGDPGQISLYERVSRALTGAPSEEAALGIAVRPDRVPVTMLAERRQRLGRGGRNGFALLVAGGVGPREVADRLAVEGYAQAGVVGLPGFDGFADGKASLGYRLSPERKMARLTLGASVSGSVQPGASRLDVGPQMELYLPAGAAPVRLSVEWRERILGDARPARGPAITLVSGF